MQTNVVILAQGRQERMGDSIAIPKQLVPLPACGNVPLLHRTFTQLVNMPWWDRDQSKITVVGWHEVFAAFEKGPLHPAVGKAPRAGAQYLPACESLADPGNSSLKGIYRYLDARLLIPGAWRPERTVVLLGDVIYSWKCLDTIFAKEWAPRTHENGMPRCRFVGSSDISPSGGEIWGIAWETNSDRTTGLGRRGVMDALESALGKHPPFQTYQPGQLRRWMWQIHPSFQATTMYERIDDYTMDIDLPDHLALVGETSVLAARDDLAHGVEW